MIALLFAGLLGHAEHAPTLRPPAELRITFDLPREGGRCEMALTENSDNVDLDGWSVRVTGPQLPGEVRGHAKMLLRHGLINRARGVPGWVLKALLTDQSRYWPSLLPATRALRGNWTPEDFELVRQTLQFLRRNTSGWAFELSWAWTDPTDGSNRRQIVTVAIPRATFPRGVLVDVQADRGAPEMVNLVAPDTFKRNTFVPVTVTRPGNF